MRLTSASSGDIQFHPTTEEIVHIDFQELIPAFHQSRIPGHVDRCSEGRVPGGKMLHLLRRDLDQDHPGKATDELIANGIVLNWANP